MTSSSGILGTEIFIGIDVGKEVLDVAIYPHGSTRSYPNTRTGIGELIQDALNLSPTLVAYENTGRLSRELGRSLSESPLMSAAVNSYQIRHFARSIPRHAKTDQLDAITISEFAALLRPIATSNPTEQEYRLSDLVTRRRQISTMIKDEKIRSHHTEGNDLRENVQEHILWLEEQQETLDEKIDALIDTNAEWRRRRDIISTFPGVGPVVTRTLVASLPELGTVSNAKIAALVGLAPFDHKSGLGKRRSRIFGGRKHVRNVLFMGSISAANYNPVLRDAYQRLKESGKPRMVIRVAIMRRMLVVLNAMVRDGTNWTDVSKSEAEA